MCGIAARIKIRFPGSLKRCKLCQDEDCALETICRPMQESIQRRGPDHFGIVTRDCEVFRVTLAASVLGIRLDRHGMVVPQPVESEDRSVFAFNGEVFSPEVFEENDTEYLGMKLSDSDGNESAIVRLMQTVSGPWAFILWHAPSQTLFFGRDPQGRRSLLFFRDDAEKDFVLSSVAPDGYMNATAWKDIEPSGIYSINLRNPLQSDGLLEPKLTPWRNNPPRRFLKLVNYSERNLSKWASDLIDILSESVRLRCTNRRQDLPIGILFSGGVDCAVLAALAHRYVPKEQAIELINVCFHPSHNSPDRVNALATWKELRLRFPERTWNLVCVDSSMEEIMLHESEIFSTIVPNTTHLDFNIGAALWFAASGVGTKKPFEKLTASSDDVDFSEKFLSTGHEESGEVVVDSTCKEKSKTENIEGKDCSLKLQRCSKIRKAKCELDACGVCCRMHQTNTQMKCKVHRSRKIRRIESRKNLETPPVLGGVNTDRNIEHTNTVYTSSAIVLFSGLGADELMAGYGRHRVAFKKQGIEALREEMRLDCGRLWKRNLGRDDRCVAARGKELRHPYLDEKVRNFLEEVVPLNVIANLKKEPGIGDKQILRMACYLLGLKQTSVGEKRAIQFGTRIAQISRTSANSNNRTCKADTPYQLLG